MPGKILLSTAYLPPVEYLARLVKAGEALIEREENYLKQSYRNRCYILSAGGKQLLSVPVLLGSVHKTLVKDIRIDYSKRWQQVHLGALTSSYNSSPYYLYYFEIIEKIILVNHKYLLDLNMDLLQAILKILNTDIKVSYTTEFKPVEESKSDFRYRINPKKNSDYPVGKYLQVFSSTSGFVPGLSVVDLIFNTGPEASLYL
jgi:arylamine N-acetyltransferase